MDKVRISVENDKIIARYYNDKNSNSFSNIYFGNDAKRFIADSFKDSNIDIKLKGKNMTVYSDSRMTEFVNYSEVFNSDGLNIDIDGYLARRAGKVKGFKRKSKVGKVTGGLAFLMAILILLKTPGVNLFKNNNDKSDTKEKSLFDTIFDGNLKDDIENFLNDKNLTSKPLEPNSSVNTENTLVPSLDELNDGDRESVSDERTNAEELENLLNENDKMGGLYIDKEYTLDFKDRTDYDKANHTKKYYYDVIKKYAMMYGVSSDLLLGIAIQNSDPGTNIVNNRGGVGLMQIHSENLNNTTIQAYNYQLGKKDYLFIDEDKIKDYKTNIKIGCMLFQNCLEYMDYNVIAALCAYNWGYDNTNTVINDYAKSIGSTREDVLKSSDIKWIDLYEKDKQNDIAFPRMVLSYLDVSKSFNNMMLASDGRTQIVRTTVHNSLVKGMK
ncbi:MAG: transglycosylase SLT domain-containing protein [bacterium]|nr:transglycosylase SLT domain-containing protein [bacterium]